jgi:hypothetical protein
MVYDGVLQRDTEGKPKIEKVPGGCKHCAIRIFSLLLFTEVGWVFGS